MERPLHAPPPGPSGTGDEVYLCDRCGTPMEERHCKIVCPRCCFTRDCSDP